MPVLHDLAPEERTEVLKPALAMLNTQEFAAALAGRAESGSLLSAMPPPMLADLLKELPQSLDGAQLASVLPAEQLQLWGVKLLSAAPESTQKGWLTQLLEQLKGTLSHSVLSSLLVSVLPAEVFAYAYANLAMDERLLMLRNIYELKRLGAVSPAPWSKQEVDVLKELLELSGHGGDSNASSLANSPFTSPVASARLAGATRQAGGMNRCRRGSVVGAMLEGPPSTLRSMQRVQLMPLDQISRTIAEIYQKKIKDDNATDGKGKLRCSMAKFISNFLLRQYGMKSMAEKALRELTATVRAYSHAGESSLVRVRMFGEMAGMLKDAQGSRPPWNDRKTDFFLYMMLRLARCFKEEAAASASPGAAGQRTTEDVARMRASVMSRTRRAQPGLTHRMSVSTGGGANSNRDLSIKDVLCREEVIISFAGIQSVIEMAVPSAHVCADFLSRLQALCQSEECDIRERPGHVHMDDVLELAMLVWDEQEEAEAPRVEQLLQTTFQKADVEGSGRMSFHSFEKFCLGLPQQLEENQVLDLFDEAIRFTEEISGESSDSVLPEGFARIVREHNLMSLTKDGTLVDVLAAGRQEAMASVSKPGARGAAAERDGDRRASSSHGRAPSITEITSAKAVAASVRDRVRRTVIKTSSSKANERSPMSTSDRKQSFSSVKPESVHKVIQTAVQSHFLFRHLDAAMHRELVQRMVPVSVVPGQDVIKQGDKGDYFYIAERGTFDVLVNDAKVHTYNASPEESRHPCFGELALLYAKPRAATIRAASTGKLWGLDRRGFRSVQMFSSGVDLTKILRRMDVLASLPFNQLQTLMNHMVEYNFSGGEYVFHQGDVGNTMFVIVQGNAIVTKAISASSSVLDDENEEEVMQLDEEMYFGERALIDDMPRAASVRALTSLKCMGIDRTTFERLLGPLQHIIDADRQRREREASAQKMQLEAAGLSGASFSSFRFEAPMARLDTGGLFAVQHLTSREPYTVRAESKHKIFELEQADRVGRELEIMRATSVHGHFSMLPAMICTFASPLALFALFKARIACDLSYFLEQVRAHARHRPRPF